MSKTIPTVCPHCGAGYKPNDRVCEYCGTLREGMDEPRWRQDRMDEPSVPTPPVIEVKVAKKRSLWFYVICGIGIIWGITLLSIFWIPITAALVAVVLLWAALTKAEDRRSVLMLLIPVAGVAIFGGCAAHVLKPVPITATTPTPAPTSTPAPSVKPKAAPSPKPAGKKAAKPLTHKPE